MHRVLRIYGAEGATSLQLGHATKVEFQNVSVRPEPLSEAEDSLREDLEAYKHVKVGLVPYELYNPLGKGLSINQTCLRAGWDTSSSTASSRPESWLSVASVGKESHALPAKHAVTGTYALIVANCGDVDHGLRLSGRIVVTNPWGELPITHYYKRTFYAFLVAASSCVAVAWLALSMQWWRRLLPFQTGVAMVAMVFVLEAILWWAFFDAWNTWGEASTTLFWCAQLASECKLASALIAMASLLLLAPEHTIKTRSAHSGWFVQVGRLMTWRHRVLLLAFWLFEFGRAACSHQRYTFAHKDSFLLANSTPVLIFSLYLWCCVHRRLARALSDVQRRGGTLGAKTDLLECMQFLLVWALGCVMLTTWLRFFDPTLTKEDAHAFLWKYHFVVSDAFPQMLSLALLLAAMWAALPNEYLQRACSASKKKVKGNVIGAVASDERDQVAAE